MSQRTEFVRLAGEFKARTGKLPSRIDWRGENLTYWRSVHGLPYPHTATIERVYGGWNHFLMACGSLPRSTQEVGTQALEHVCRRYPDVEVMPGHSGTIDCFIDGERVEVKGATLSRDSFIHTPRWRFRLHHRDYSLLVDRVILVGLAGGKPVVEWSFDKVDTVMYLDGKDALSITARQAFGGGHYTYAFQETWKEDLTYEEVLALENLHE